MRENSTPEKVKRMKCSRYESVLEGMQKRLNALPDTKRSAEQRWSASSAR
jgi:hypothetical protein